LSSVTTAKNKPKIWLGRLVLLLLTLSACAPLETPPTASPESPTPFSEVTATVVWFPPTAIPTPIPTKPVTPTPDLHPGLGEVIFSDDFSSPGSWSLSRTSQGGAALGHNELTIAILEPRTYIYSVRSEPVLSDFYLEITASPTLCRETDEYGLLFRLTSPADFYRFSLSCDSQVRLDRLVNGTASSPQPWMFSGVIPPGAPNIARLGVWVRSKEMRFFINDQFQFTVSDPLLPSGSIGVFARSAGDYAVTVNFSDLVVREISQ